MRRKITILASILLFFTLSVIWLLRSRMHVEPVQAQAAAIDYFLKIPDVHGEARDDHEGEIEIESWSWGESEPGVMLEAVGQGRGGALHSNQTDFNFVTRMSKASPKLMQYSASGKQLEEAVLVGIKSGEQSHKFMEIKLKPVYISSYQTGGSSGEVPIDNFSLNFEKIEFKYTPQDETGNTEDSVEGSWDFNENKTVE